MALDAEDHLVNLIIYVATIFIVLKQHIVLLHVPVSFRCSKLHFLSWLFKIERIDWDKSLRTVSSNLIMDNWRISWLWSECVLGVHGGFLRSFWRLYDFERVRVKLLPYLLPSNWIWGVPCVIVDIWQQHMVADLIGSLALSLFVLK
jgi:hypothetical protein